MKHPRSRAIGAATAAVLPRHQLPPAAGFTLVELLVVMMLLLMLAAVGLPTVKELIKDQKTAHTARNIVAYIEGARSKAIATGQPVGVLFERFGIADPFSRSYSIRMRMSNSVPPYSGESETSVATLYHLDSANPSNRTGIVNAALFDHSDNPLLFLSAQKSGVGDAPIRVGDYFEIEGGRSVRITQIGFAANTDPAMIDPANRGVPNPTMPGQTVKILFDPRQVIPYRGTSSTNSYIYPSGLVTTTGTDAARFRIHRFPTASNVDSLELLRGMAVDLNYSGIGPDGTHFAASTVNAPFAADTSSAHNFQPVVIMFAPDGSVAFSSWGYSATPSSEPIALVERPAGNLYFLLGKADQVRPDALFLDDGREQANIMDLESIWITVNPNNGNVYAAPVASVSTTTSPEAAVLQSREFALQADTLSSN